MSKRRSDKPDSPNKKSKLEEEIPFESFSDDEIPLENDESAPSEANRGQRQEKKRIAKERKLQKAFGQEIEGIKKLWEKLREKTGVSNETREQLVSEIFDLVNKQWSSVVFRHDSSRVVQTVFKYSNADQKLEITQELKGNYLPLAKSTYGKYLLVNMLKFGSQQVRTNIINELNGNIRKLIKQQDGAYVLNELYTLYATSAQKKLIMQQFFGPEFALFKSDAKTLKDLIEQNPEKEKFLMANLYEVIQQALRKGSIGLEIVHAMMLEFVRNLKPNSELRTEFLELVSDDIVEVVHTKNGSMVASLVLAISNAKERKRLLKSLRKFPIELATNEFGNFVMMAAFLTVDDTKHTYKAFEQITSNADILKSKFGRRPYLLLLLGPKNKKYFSDLQQKFKEIEELKVNTSKKPDEQRRKELLEYFMPPVRTLVIDNIKDIMKESLGSQFVMEMVINDQNPDVIASAVSAFEGDPSSKKHALNVNPFLGRTAKVLVHESPRFRELYLPIVKDSLEEFATGEGCFSVIALLEDTKDKDLKKAVLRAKKDIKNSGVRGGDLLVKIASE